jgi:hypothetical protein
VPKRRAAAGKLRLGRQTASHLPLYSVSLGSSAEEKTYLLDALFFEALFEWESVFSAKFTEEITQRRRKLVQLQHELDGKHFPTGDLPNRPDLLALAERDTITYVIAADEERRSRRWASLEAINPKHALPGLDPGIHVLETERTAQSKAWTAGSCVDGPRLAKDFLAFVHRQPLAVMCPACCRGAWPQALMGSVDRGLIEPARSRCPMTRATSTPGYWPWPDLTVAPTRPARSICPPATAAGPRRGSD